MGRIWESINASNQHMLTHVPNGQIAGSPLCQAATSGKWALTFLTHTRSGSCGLLPHPSDARCVRFYYTISAADGVGELRSYCKLLRIGDLRGFRRWKKLARPPRILHIVSGSRTQPQSFPRRALASFNATATAPRFLLCRWVSRSILLIPFGG